LKKDIDLPIKSIHHESKASTEKSETQIIKNLLD